MFFNLYSIFLRTSKNIRPTLYHGKSFSFYFHIHLSTNRYSFLHIYHVQTLTLIHSAYINDVVFSALPLYSSPSTRFKPSIAYTSIPYTRICDGRFKSYSVYVRTHLDNIIYSIYKALIFFWWLFFYIFCRLDVIIQNLSFFVFNVLFGYYKSDFRVPKRYSRVPMMYCQHSVINYVFDYSRDFHLERVAFY